MAEEIHRNVNDINSLVIQVSADAEQTAVTSLELAKLAEQQGLVGRFKVADGKGFAGCSEACER